MKPTDNYILKQPPFYQSILLHLISLFDSEYELFLKYGVPFFYYKNKPFCYLVVNQKKKYVDLSFINGYKISKNTEHLIADNRKIVRSLRYFNIENIDNDLIINVIDELKNLELKVLN